MPKTLLEASCITRGILATQEANFKMWVRKAKVLNKATDLEKKEYLVEFFNEVIIQVAQEEM